METNKNKTNNSAKKENETMKDKKEQSGSGIGTLGAIKAAAMKATEFAGQMLETGLRYGVLGALYAIDGGIWVYTSVKKGVEYLWEKAKAAGGWVKGLFTSRKPILIKPTNIQTVVAQA